MVLVDMLRTYSRQGHQMAVAYFSPGPLAQELAILGVPAHQISRSGLADPMAVIRLFGLMWRLRPHVVHTQLVKSDLVGQLAARLARVPARVSSAQNTDPWRRRFMLTFVNRLVTCGCQKVIAVSSEVRDYLLSVRAFPLKKIVVMENSIDIAQFDPERQQPVDRISAWGFGPDDPTIGVIGRLEPQKGHRFLLEAAARVVKEIPRARFLIIGDGPLRSELESQSSRLGLDGQVVFTGVRRDIPAILAALDVVTLSSLWEGLPVALLEAMAMEKPVVATAVGGVPDVVHDGHNGLLVPAGDPDELARGLLRVLRDPVAARRMGQQAREAVRRRYTTDSMHQRIFALYRSLSD